MWFKKINREKIVYFNEFLNEFASIESKLQDEIRGPKISSGSLIHSRCCGVYFEKILIESVKMKDTKLKISEMEKGKSVSYAQMEEEEEHSEEQIICRLIQTVPLPSDLLK